MCDSLQRLQLTNVGCEAIASLLGDNSNKLESPNKKRKAQTKTKTHTNESAHGFKWSTILSILYSVYYTQYTILSILYSVFYTQYTSSDEIGGSDISLLPRQSDKDTTECPFKLPLVFQGNSRTCIVQVSRLNKQHVHIYCHNQSFYVKGNKKN